MKKPLPIKNSNSIPENVAETMLRTANEIIKQDDILNLSSFYNHGVTSRRSTSRQNSTNKYQFENRNP